MSQPFQHAALQEYKELQLPSLPASMAKGHVGQRMGGAYSPAEVGGWLGKAGLWFPPFTETTACCFSSPEESFYDLGGNLLNTID